MTYIFIQDKLKTNLRKVLVVQFFLKLIQGLSSLFLSVILSCFKGILWHVAECFVSLSKISEGEFFFSSKILDIVAYFKFICENILSFLFYLLVQFYLKGYFPLQVARSTWQVARSSYETFLLRGIVQWDLQVC